MTDLEGRLDWFKLLTTDIKTAEAFYAGAIGWRMADSGLPSMTYTFACTGERHVSGIMTLPKEICE